MQLRFHLVDTKKKEIIFSWLSEWTAEDRSLQLPPPWLERSAEYVLSFKKIRIKAFSWNSVKIRLVTRALLAA